MVFLNLGLTTVLLVATFFRPPCSHAASAPNPGKRPFLSPSPYSSNEATFQHGLEEGWVYLLDWDDTLFPTTWKNEGGGDDKKDGPNGKVLREIMDIRVEILESLQKKGHTYIVSNADDNWLKESRTFWYGSIGTLPEDHVISARDWYKNVHGGKKEDVTDAKKWKPYVFIELVRWRLRKEGKKVTDVMVAGDQNSDKNAGLEMQDKLESTLNLDIHMMKGDKLSLKEFKKELEELLKYLKDQRGAPLDLLKKYFAEVKKKDPKR